MIPAQIEGVWCDMVALLSPNWVHQAACISVQEQDYSLLNHLRFINMQCRAKPRTDLFKACALLHGDSAATMDAHAEALVRCLGEALGKPARIFAPGTVERSFDENWLVQLGLASARGDCTSVSFLLASRIGPEHRRLVRFLIHQIFGVNSQT